VLLIAWSFRDYATLWRGRWQPLPLQPALSSEARAGDWTMWRGNAQRTGVQVQPGAVPSGQVDWQFVNGAGFISSPIAAGDSLYVADTQGRLSRLQRSTGQVLWRLQGLGPFDASPALAEDLLYIGLRDGRLLAIQTANGVIRWHFATGNPIYASPLVHQGVLYIGSGDGLVYALDAISGMERWRAHTEGWVHSSPALLDELVYVGSNDGALYFIDRRTGVPRWRYRTSQAIRATPTIAEGLILFGGEDGWFRAIAARTLGARWTYAWRWVRITLFVWGFTGPPPSLPGFRWQYRTRDPIVASAAVAHGLVYVASQRGTLTALEHGDTALVFCGAAGHFCLTGGRR
jgi:hypothetical protein